MHPTSANIQSAFLQIGVLVSEEEDIALLTQGYISAYEEVFAPTSRRLPEHQLENWFLILLDLYR